MKRKRIYQNPIFWLVGAAVVAGAGIATLAALNPTYVAETAPDHPNANLRTRRYHLKGDLKQMRQEVEKVIRALQTKIWGGNWQIVPPQAEDSQENKEIIRATVPVAIFTDDLRVEIQQDGDKAIVNARSNSRFDGNGSDFGENRRHLLQLLQALDAKLTKTVRE